MNQKSPFIHLHTHSHYSLLDGLSKIPEMIALAKSYNMPALALTDHGALYGAIQFYKECKKAGIKPIIGVEAYIAKRTRHDKQPGIDNKRFHLTLLAKNNTGYHNLIKLVTLSHLEGYYYKPRMDKELLRTYGDGLICLSGCFGSELSRALRNKNTEEAEKVIHEHQEIFGKENYFLEIMHHPEIEGLDEVRAQTIALGKKFNIPLVATHDSHYLHKEDARAHDTLIAIQTNTDIGDEKRLTFAGSDFHFIDSDTAWNNFKDIPEAIENTKKIADMCDIELKLGSWIFPDFKVTEGVTHDTELKRLTYEGLAFRSLPKTKEIEDRIAYELNIITAKQFSPYFLTVADLLRFARENNILTNTRGSVAGSLVSYLLGITNVNPLEYKLPFERFLNPLRPSAPDIDMDFEDTRRDEVIQYAKQKYGDAHVAQIGTYGTMMARGAVRDVARSLGKPYVSGDRIAKLIPFGSQGFPMSIDRALETTPELRELHDKEAEVREIVDLAKRLEGCARHVSVHAAGVVISDKELVRYTPLQRETKGDKIVTQYDMYTVGEDGVGLLKMDLLGLRNLTIIEEALNFIKQNRGKELNISIIPLDDKKTYDLLSDAETTGIFQLESSGMRRYIKDLKPTSIFDLMAMVALYRPGPMANIPEYISRRHKKSLISLPDARLKDVLEQSNGMLVYQDDVLLTTIAIAGYNWLEADKFRKAMGKKIPADMKKQKEQFINGSVANGLSPKKAEEIFNLIAPFAGYGFNKAHAACYATIAYRTAYLKANYSVEFMTALLTAESRGSTGPVKNEKIAQAIAECKRLKINVLPPDINKSDKDFTIENKENIRFGLSAIKNVGDAAIKNVLSQRSIRPFKSLNDFCMRVDLSTINKKTIESLIKAGAMDQFGNRAYLLTSYQEIVDQIGREKKQKVEGQESLFGDENDHLTPNSNLGGIDDFSTNEKLAFEKEFLGFYLTSHPQMDNLLAIKSQISHELDLLDDQTEGQVVKIGGIIEGSRRIFTKKTGSEMAFISIGNEKGIIIDCIIFPKIFEKYKNFITKDNLVILEGRVDTKNERPIIIAEKISLLGY
ncbi:MAG: DNA polymerase III subunit alpha [Parcubacteria group bacterium]|nr:DNA polymerase III subunit alpha [Parcubacteria group bacterium]